MGSQHERKKRNTIIFIYFFDNIYNYNIIGVIVSTYNVQIYLKEGFMSENVTSKEDIINFLRKNKILLKNDFDVDNIMLFGSYARDEATPTSDIDILIESKTKSFDKSYRLKVFLEKNLKKDVDVIYIDSVHPFIMRSISEELIYA